MKFSYNFSLNTFSSAVTCLSVSIDGQALVSGSNDKNVKIWHINSHQCMRTIPHHGKNK